MYDQVDLFAGVHRLLNEQPIHYGQDV